MCQEKIWSRFRGNSFSKSWKFFIHFSLMSSREENLARFLFYILRQISIEFRHMKIISNHYEHRPKKSILRQSTSILSVNQNHSLSIHRRSVPRQVLFTHIDSFAFDPEMPCRFVGQPNCQQFYSIENLQIPIKCLNHENSLSTQKKSKRKRKRNPIRS